MNFQALDCSNQTEVATLFNAVFTASEGPQEGALIGNLSSALASSIDNKEVIGFGAYENVSLIGAIFFTCLKFDHAAEVYMLSPVAVSTKHQGKGIGQALINHGLDALKKLGVSIVVTYGDPLFYAKVGFKALSENIIQAPHQLSMPFGWLGQSLTDEPIAAIKARPICVKAFDHPELW